MKCAVPLELSNDSFNSFHDTYFTACKNDVRFYDNIHTSCESDLISSHLRDEILQYDDNE